ncbi:MAG TPA: PCMD domain-containing protein [Bacteroidia bacterium]|nr:PCMD domain-containing protein [Bacteroidia bacterium]
MIKSLLLFQLLILTLGVQAQIALPNPGFENWTTVSNYEDPDNWHTLNPSTAFVGVLTATKASGADVHSGSFAIKLTTKSVFGQTANGLATTGTIDVQNQTITGGIAYSLRPDSITGWFKCTPVSGDNGFVDFVLLDNANDTVGLADFTTPTTSVSTYTYFSVPIVYRNSNTPSISRTTLSSSAGYTSVVNSTMYVDDLQLIFNSTAVAPLLTIPIQQVFYSSADHGLYFSSGTVKGNRLRVYNEVGQNVYESMLQETNFLSLPFLSPGVYIYQLESKAELNSGSGRFVIN